MATAPGGAAGGIVRIAGPDAVPVVANRFRSAAGRLLSDIRVPTRLDGDIVLADLGGRRLPCELYLWPSDRSYCRTPMAEIHTLGSPPLLAAVLRSVCQGGARVAAPGEFTLRAFLGGRIDLAQAEAVLGVIDARGARDFQVALSQLSGGLSQPLAQLRESLLDSLAHLEAGLDFVEEDIEFISSAGLDAQLAGAIAQIESLRSRMDSRTDAAQAVRVVLRGLPNAGKSSLFNALSQRFASAASASRALVSPQPGTTRDYLQATLTLGPIQCELIDTAGLEKTDVPAGPDRDAQEKARRQIASADIVIYCLDASQPAGLEVPVAEDDSTGVSGSVLIALTKCDLPPRMDPAVLGGTALVMRTSAATGAGLDDLAQALQQLAGDSAVNETSVVAATAQRCRESLATAAASLKEARQLIAGGGAEELLAAEIRAALHALGHVTGTVYTDDILDRIFSRFCIGK